MEEELGLDNILGADAIENLFVDTNTSQEDNESSSEETNETKETTEVNVDTLFADKPESVGSEENIETRKDTSSTNTGTSPNFYSSIAKALQEEGVFPNLSAEDFTAVNEASALKELIEKQIKAGLDEKQQRINEALEAAVPVDSIKSYENTLGTLQGISEEILTQEGSQGESLRKNLIYQDFINRGYSQERALKEIEKSFNAGTDIDDARDALQGNIEYYQKAYQDLINQGKQRANKANENLQHQAEELKTSILKDDAFFKELNVDSTTRQRIHDNVSKASFKDEKTGNYLTPIQQYQQEHPVDFLKNLSLFFTLTNGFKDLGSLVKNKVNKEVKKGLKGLEHTLNTTARTSDGSLNFVSGVSEDPESFLTKGWKLDI